MALPTYDSTESDSGNLGTVTTLTHTIPGGWSSGNLCLAQITCASNRSITSTTSGFTQIGTNNAGASMWWKILNSGDIGASKSWTCNFSSSGPNQIVFMQISGHDATTPINIYAQTTTGSFTTTHVSPSVTTTVNDCLIIRTFFSGSVMTASSGDTGTSEVSNYYARIWRSSKTSAGSTGTATYTTGSSLDLAMFTVAIAPTGGGGDTKAALIGSDILTSTLFNGGVLIQ